MIKKNSRVEGKTVKVKRQDIRIPIDFYNRLKKIAVERFNAPIHHRSNEPAITKTLLKLAELGIEYLESGLTADKKTEIITTEVLKRLDNLESNQSDNNNDNLTGKLVERIETLEQKITDKSQDKVSKKLLKRIDSLERRLNDINNDKNHQELTDRLEILEKQLAEINTDTKAEIPEQKAEVIEQQEMDETVTKEPKQSENADNNNDIYNDNIETFYSGVKDAFSSSNDPDNKPDDEKKTDIIDKPELDKTNIEIPTPTAVIKETGLTDKQLAEEFGVSPTMIKRWRTGSSKPRGNNAKRLKQWEFRGDLWYKKTN
ncbi:MAG: helix-turn-helix transcriptional regulator [Prochloraceae cyanobacterium]|nr:helix-turn-helix transcriptional regulator [Prochloraceae cyanobacterium]